MHKTIATLLAGAFFIAPVMAPAVYAAPMAKDEHRLAVHKGSWARGHRLSPSDRRRAVPLDASHHHLSTPPHGFQWVRIGGSFLMVGQTSGLILKVVAAR